MKICCTCKCEKDSTIELFCKNKNTDDGLSVQCKDCAKKYREDHKQDKKNYPSSSPEYRKIYIENNIDHINYIRRVRYNKNPEKFRAECMRSHFNHRDERLLKQHIYYEANKAVFAIKTKAYRKENMDSILLSNRQREKRISKFPKIQQSEVNQLLINNDHKCFYCKVGVKRGINLHLDHKMPLSRGGAHTIDNLVPSCATCNLRKGTKTPEEFLNRNK
jgi:5-methylcytosine-specific restriction endonuclease McrA